MVDLAKIKFFDRSDVGVYCNKIDDAKCMCDILNKIAKYNRLKYEDVYDYMKETSDNGIVFYDDGCVSSLEYGLKMGYKVYDYNFNIEIQ